MPALTDHKSSETTKLLFIGDTGAGKTGALASLAASGYNLRILDFDNGLDILKSYLTNPKSPYVIRSPKCAENVRYVTLTDRMKNINGQLFAQEANAWTKAMEMLSNWVEKDEKGEIIFKAGPVSSWGTNDVLVIDSLSMLSQAAMNFHLKLNGGLMKERKGYDAQRDMNGAQNLIRAFLMLLYDSSIKCNIVMISHIKFSNEITVRKQDGDGEASAQTFGTPQGYPNAIGAALGPQIGRWFNSLLIARSGHMGRHKIHTSGQNLGGIMVNAKTSAPLNVANEYPLDWGLAEYFKAVKGA